MPKKPEPRYVAPTLESITIKGKYIIPQTSFSVLVRTVSRALGPIWHSLDELGESVRFLDAGTVKQPKTAEKAADLWQKRIKEVRHGVPVSFSITTLEHLRDGILAEVECRPAMWYRISIFREVSFTENQVQEALLECRNFVKELMSIFRGKEVEPVSVYPIIQRTEIKSRLQNLGLQEIVDKLDKAEEHIVQNNFSESLKSSRTAFEKMIDWQMNKRGLDQTNSYHNNLEHIKSKGYLDPETTKLLQTYYECLSIVVHEKGIKPGIFEAQMGYGITLIMLDYFANKLP